MGDDELADLRRRRLEQLQRQSVDQQSMDEQLQRQKQAEAQIHHVLMQILEPEARERLANIKLTKPDFARNIEQQLVALAQSGRLEAEDQRRPARRSSSVSSSPRRRTSTSGECDIPA